MKELPFVLGVLSDLSVSPKRRCHALRDRKFGEIDRDNFDRRDARHEATSLFRVDNKLTDDNISSNRTSINSIEDLRAEQVADSRAASEALETRLQLQRYWPRMDATTNWPEKLQEIIGNTDMLKQIGSEVGCERDGKGGRQWQRSKGRQVSARPSRLSKKPRLLDRSLTQTRSRNDEQRRVWRQITNPSRRSHAGQVRVSRISRLRSARVSPISTSSDAPAERDPAPTR